MAIVWKKRHWKWPDSPSWDACVGLIRRWLQQSKCSPYLDAYLSLILSIYVKMVGAGKHACNMSTGEVQTCESLGLSTQASKSNCQAESLRDTFQKIKKKKQNIHTYSTQSKDAFFNALQWFVRLTHSSLPTDTIATKFNARFIGHIHHCNI